MTLNHNISQLFYIESNFKLFYTTRQTLLEDSTEEHQDPRFYIRQILRVLNLDPRCCTLATTSVKVLIDSLEEEEINDTHTKLQF